MSHFKSGTKATGPKLPPRSRHRWRSAGWTALCALLLAALAGCDGGDDGTGGTGGSGGAGGAGGSPAPLYDPFPLPAQEWRHGDPTPLEQALLEEIQRARLDPTAEVDIVLAVPGAKSAMQYFGTDEGQVRADFMTYSPVPPLSFDPRLIKAARAHSQDMATSGIQSHQSTSGETFADRVDAAGYEWSSLAENVFAHADSVPYCHAAFMIDWGNAEPGHRHAILDVEKPKRDVGIGIVEDPAHEDVGPLVVTQDFGMPDKLVPGAERYVVGVAYDDADENGAYDPGEGIAGLRVVPEAGGFHAITSTSGGFSVPISTETGPFRVQIEDDTGLVLDQKDIERTGENVKVDFVF